jgi:hypothetical protein
MSNNYPEFHGNNPYPYHPMPVAGKSSFGFALAAIIAGALGITMVAFVLMQMVNGTQNDSFIPIKLQEIIGLIGLLLTVGSGVLAVIGIFLNKSRVACGVILGVMSLPIMITLWILAVLSFTALGIG